MDTIKFVEYSFYAERLCLGERKKGGIFHPSARVLAYSQIRGAFYQNLGLKVHGVGVLENTNQVNYLTMAPQDRVTGKPRVPLTVMFLEDVKGKVYLLDEDDLSSKLDDKLDLHIGGLKSRGLGKCLLKDKNILEIKEDHYIKGILNTRLPKAIARKFGIVEEYMPQYGYLFEPLDEETGHYILSYFEGTTVRGPKIFLKPEGN